MTRTMLMRRISAAEPAQPPITIEKVTRHRHGLAETNKVMSPENLRTVRQTPSAKIKLLMEDYCDISGFMKFQEQDMNESLERFVTFATLGNTPAGIDTPPPRDRLPIAVRLYRFIPTSVSTCIVVTCDKSGNEYRTSVTLDKYATLPDWYLTLLSEQPETT